MRARLDLLRTTGARRGLATWIVLALVGGLGSLVPHRGEGDEQRVSVQQSGPSIPALPLPSLLPEVGIPPVTVPPITVPPVTLPPVTVPPVVRPVLEVVQGIVEELLCSPHAPVEIGDEGLWLVDADSGCVQVLRLGAEHRGLSFAPDGIRAVVSIPEDDGDRGLDRGLWVVDLRTGLRTRIHVGYGIGNLSWSPDGQWIAYHGLPTAPRLVNPSAPDGPHGAGEIWIVRPDGREARRVAATDGFGGVLAWSPDGRRLATALANDDRVLVLDVAAGTELRHPYADPYLASWSPDGAQLAVSASHRTQTSLMDPTTGATRTIVPGACFPRWSPSGEWVAVADEDTLVLVHPDGGGRRELGSGGPINWSGDGRLLLHQGGTSSVQVTDVATMQTRTVVVAGDRGPWPQASRWIPGTHRFAVIGTGAVHYTP